MDSEPRLAPQCGKIPNLTHINVFVNQLMETFSGEMFVRMQQIECIHTNIIYTLDLFMPAYNIIFNFDNQGDTKSDARRKNITEAIEHERGPGSFPVVTFIDVEFLRTINYSAAIGRAFSIIKRHLKVPCASANALAELKERNEELKAALYVAAELALKPTGMYELD